MVKKKYRKRKETGPRQDLTGQRFGKLTVTGLAGKRSYPNGESKFIWDCKCDCGNETTPTGNALRTGNTKSCRICVYEREDLTGQTFGKLEVLSPAPDSFDGRNKAVTRWNCKCSCGGTHIANTGNLKAGSVKSCGCLFFDVQEKDLIKRKEEFLEKASNLHNSKYSYDVSKFENGDSLLDIECPEHGTFQQKVRDHMAGSGCQKCFLESRLVGTEEFIRRSALVHNDTYDYSLVEYVKSSEKVKIICPAHGVFEQIPTSHLQGHKCFECSADERHWNYKHYCERNPEFAEKEGCLYLLRLLHEGESFLKVGVSINIGNRIAKYKQEGLDVEPLYIIDTTAEDSANKEIDTLDYIKSNGWAYLPKVKFGGRTECASEDYESEIVEYFRRLDGGKNHCTMQ